MIIYFYLLYLCKFYEKNFNQLRLNLYEIMNEGGKNVLRRFIGFV